MTDALAPNKLCTFPVGGGNTSGMLLDDILSVVWFNKVVKSMHASRDVCLSSFVVEAKKTFPVYLL